MATCVERSGERLAALCLRRLGCVSSAWPPWLGCGARARRARPAASCPWLKLVFGPWRGDSATFFCWSAWLQLSRRRRQRNFRYSGRSGKRRGPKTETLAQIAVPVLKSGLRVKARTSRRARYRAVPGTPTNPAQRTCGVRLALGGGKLAPQFCARGGGAGLPSAHQRGATSAKKGGPIVGRRGAAGVSITRARRTPRNYGKDRRHTS